jgi:hypothetical protein
MLMSLSNQKINIYFNTTLSDTDDIKFNLNQFLDFNSIKIYIKSYVFSYMNRKILDITFKFNIGLNMQLIYDYFYTLKKKCRLINF